MEMINKTVFIIDDDPIVRFLVEKMMSKVNSDLAFIQCENGKIGLDKLQSHKGDLSRCIVLLDLNMPELNGWQFLDEIQSGTIDNYDSIPIYILSSSTDKEDIERAKEYSIVKKFYHKPMGIDDINELLNQ